MPIFSYLAIPAQGQQEKLCSDLQALDYCEVIPSDNQEVVVLVTATPDKETDKQLQAQLKELASLQSLSMTYGHADDNKPQ